jgi:hypothetical protein
LRSRKALDSSRPFEHERSYIQSELDNPIYAAGNPRIISNPKPSGWGASPHRWMKKNITIAFLAVATLTFALLYGWERLKREVIEEEYLHSSLLHLFAGAMETVWLRSNQEETYFYLMESTFESLPEVIEAKKGLELNEASVENTKEMIAHYYVLSGYKPSHNLTEFLGDYLEKDYEPYEGFDLPESREELLEMIENNRTEMGSNQSE